MAKKEMETVYLQFGLRVKQLRESLGWKQEDIATKVGLTRASIANIESGKQRVLLDDVTKFARAFGCTEKHLMRGIWT